MIILVESRCEVGEAFVSGFSREGVAAAVIKPEDIIDWCAVISRIDLGGVQGIIFGLVAARAALARAVKLASGRPMIALAEMRSLDETLDLFAHGIDDVVAKPVHVRELLARLRIISARQAACSLSAEATKDIVQSDERDALVGGAPLAMPRRERRIIECLVSARGAWRTKTQIFNDVYGLISGNFEEYLIESHISRLRKRLRGRLGRDAIEAQRFLDYRLRGIALRGETAVDPVPRILEKGLDAQQPRAANALSGV